MAGKWPIVEGRYKLGSSDSPVAICTMASIDLVDQIPRDGVAVIGKCVTENLGIEKIVENIAANPKIRFLILCGRVSKGHFVGQAIRCLVENGIDPEGRIIGARGAMPVLKNVSMEKIEQFRRQVEPIDLIGVENTQKITQAVKDCLYRNPGPFAMKEGLKREEMEPLTAEWDEENEYVQDPSGFFVIHLDNISKSIIVEHYSNDRKLQKKLKGDNARDIYQTIIRLGLLSRHDHAAYLGRELAKAELALKNSLQYEQDRDLNIQRI